MTKASPQVQVKSSPPLPIVTMIVPGRRALGEGWRKVTVGVEDDEIKVTGNDATEPPTDSRPIFVPALGNISLEMADYMLEWQRKQNDYRTRRGLTPHSQVTGPELQQLFYEWLQLKIKAWKGQTISGPGGWTQRERTVPKRWALKYPLMKRL